MQECAEEESAEELSFIDFDGLHVQYLRKPLYNG